MPSPFPGMNPYLERPTRWTDFHNTFIVTARAALARQVGERYFVQVEEHVYIEAADEGDRELIGIADVSVTADDRQVATAAGATLVAPATVTIPGLAKRKLAFLTVRDRDGDRVVTVIEMLSPTNKKPGDDRDDFVMKRRRLVSNGVNYVEIDLLRGGRRPPIRGLPKCDYYALVYRPAGKSKAGVWPIQLRDRLPEIPIPLAVGDSEATLDLQAILHEVHDSAHYGRKLYRRPPVPPLSPADAAWAEALIAATAPTGGTA